MRFWKMFDGIAWKLLEYEWFLSFVSWKHGIKYSRETVNELKKILGRHVD